MAEGVGFEPTRPFGLPVFKTGAINHSTTPPENLDREKCAIAERLSKRRSAILIGCSAEHYSTRRYVHVNLAHHGSEGQASKEEVRPSGKGGAAVLLPCPWK